MTISDRLTSLYTTVSVTLCNDHMLQVSASPLGLKRSRRREEAARALTPEPRRRPAAPAAHNAYSAKKKNTLRSNQMHVMFHAARRY